VADGHVAESGRALWLSDGYPIVSLPESGEPHVISKFSATFSFIVCSRFMQPHIPEVANEFLM
jgi:hypothetical protein